MRLLTVAHGTRLAAGNEVARELTAVAGARMGLSAEATYVELCAPLFSDAVGASEEAGVVVPLLLSTGYHLRVDLPAAIEAVSGGRDLRLGPALGPDSLLAAAQVARLEAAGARRGQPVVLVAAGSNDPLAVADIAKAGRLLARSWGGTVRVAVLSGVGPRVADVVRPGDAVSPYLLAPGFFADRARDQAEAAGASVVADVIGTHDAVVELVCRRADALLAGLIVASA
ncbi:sirohydrochlorin chelatase [Nocardioides montaniterrae]